MWVIANDACDVQTLCHGEDGCTELTDGRTSSHSLKTHASAARQSPPVCVVRRHTNRRASSHEFVPIRTYPAGASMTTKPLEQQPLGSNHDL